MKPRIIVLFLALLGGAGWWVLRSVPVSELEAHEASLADEASEPLVTLGSGESVEKPIPVESTDPLVRQRERLRDTAARLASRRDEARAKEAREITIRALDAHLERIEQQLAELGVDPSSDVSVADTRGWRVLLSPGSGQ